MSSEDTKNSQMLPNPVENGVGSSASMDGEKKSILNGSVTLISTGIKRSNEDDDEEKKPDLKKIRVFPTTSDENAKVCI